MDVVDVLRHPEFDRGDGVDIEIVLQRNGTPDRSAVPGEIVNLHLHLKLQVNLSLSYY